MPATVVHTHRHGGRFAWLPWTMAGWLLLSVSAIGAWWVYAEAKDHLLRVAALVGLFLPMAGMLPAWASLRPAIKRLRMLGLTGACCGDSLDVAVPWADVRMLHPPTDNQGVLLRRGTYSEVSFEAYDPFRLVRLRRRTVLSRPLVVYPAPSEPVNLLEVATQSANGETWSMRGRPDGELLEIGPYQRGDPVKLILWRLAARTGSQQLFVRRPERSTSSKTAYYFIAGPGDDKNAELLDYLLRHELTGEYDVFGFSHEPDTCWSNRHDARKALVESGKVDTSPEYLSFESFEQTVVGQQIKDCILFLPLVMADIWLTNPLSQRLRVKAVCAIQEGCTTPVNSPDGLHFISMTTRRSTS